MSYLCFEMFELELFAMVTGGNESGRTPSQPADQLSGARPWRPHDADDSCIGMLLCISNCGRGCANKKFNF
jgi:hypothetical protein